MTVKKLLNSISGKLQEQWYSYHSKLLLSYVIILIVPIILGAILFMRVETLMIEHQNQANMAMLKQVKQVVDDRFQEVEHFSQQLSSTPKVQGCYAKSLPAIINILNL